MNITIFSTNIKNLRTKKNWSQDDLADFLGVTRQAVSKWENEVSLPDIDTLLMVSKLFQITINDLLEMNVIRGIKSFEEISKVDRQIVLNALKEFSFDEVVKATKGSSPTVITFMNKLYNDLNLEQEVKTLAPVRLTEVVAIQERIVQSINLNFSLL